MMRPHSKVPMKTLSANKPRHFRSILIFMLQVILILAVMVIIDLLVSAKGGGEGMPGQAIVIPVAAILLGRHLFKRS